MPFTSFRLALDGSNESPSLKVFYEAAPSAEHGIVSPDFLFS